MCLLSCNYSVVLSVYLIMGVSNNRGSAASSSLQQTVGTFALYCYNVPSTLDIRLNVL